MKCEDRPILEYGQKKSGKGKAKKKHVHNHSVNNAIDFLESHDSWISSSIYNIHDTT